VELTDEMIAEVQALVGRPLRVEQFNHEATIDTIRHYAWGVGDDNPLYCDEDYAALGPYGVITAPPTFLFSVFSGALGLGLPGFGLYGGGSAWEFLEPVRAGDRLRVHAAVGPTRVATSRRAGRFAIQTTRNAYERVADGVTVARSEGRTLRVAPGHTGDGAAARAPTIYSHEELEAIRRHAVAEPRRGATPRLWEQVAVGEELPPTVKGPIDLKSTLAYHAGCLGSPRTTSAELRWKRRTAATEAPERLPDNYDPALFAPPLPFTADPDAAQRAELSDAYNNGAQTTAWLAHTVLNWMGDHGRMTRLEARLTRPAIFGDTVWCRATVSARPAPGVVELTTTATNQVGLPIASGTAEVRLPIRDEESAP